MSVTDERNGLTHLQRLELLIGHYEKTDRILSRKKVKCVLQRAYSPLIAYTVDTTINFTGPRLPPLETVEDYIITFGVNLHELSHVMFSPKAKDIATHSGLRNIVSKPHLGVVWNILEDQRIESLMSALYPSTRNYFTMVVMEYIANNVEGAHLLTYGRKFLPRDLRDQLRANYSIQGPDLVLLEKCIDEYRVLDLRQYSAKNDAARIVEHVYQILLRKQDALPTQKGCDSAGASKNGKQDKTLQEEDEKASEPGDKTPMDRAKEALDDRKDEDASERGDGQRGDDGDRGDGEGDGENGEGEGPSVESAGAGAGTGRADIRETVASVRANITIDEDVLQDVLEAQKVVEGNKKTPLIHTTKVNVSQEPVSGDAKQMMRKMVAELRRAETDVDPMWETGQSSGTLDIRRAMGRDPHDETLYRQWNVGNTYGTDQEIVVLLDASSSMSGSNEPLSTAGWVMKRAGDSYGANVTVLTFGSRGDGRVLYTATDKADSDRMQWVYTSGGTEPVGQLGDAYAVFRRSTKRHKMMFVMTDGDWASEGSAFSKGTSRWYVNEIHKLGVQTDLFHLDPGRHGNPLAHGMHRAAYIDSMYEMIAIVKNNVRRTILGEQSNRRRARR